MDKRLKETSYIKVAGQDKTVTEMLTTLEDIGLDKTTEIINEIYDSGKF